jgi:predicted TIM-barrel fold metal-dependent hydrolase
MSDPENVSRRTALLGLGATGAAAIGAGATPTLAQPAGSASPRHARVSPGEIRALVRQRVEATPFVDTHEHLLEEKTRLAGAGSPEIPCDDWAFLLAHYFHSDLVAAGMPEKDQERLFSATVDPLEKWRIVEPWWPLARHTGYGRAVALALQELYGVDSLSASTVARAQAGYEALRKPGFYEKVLRGHANVSSAQVNCLEGVPFLRSAQPALLMQDIFLNGMFDGPDFQAYGPPSGIRARTLTDWHRVIDWWFDEHGPWAVAVKSSNAYSRNIDYADVAAEAVEASFRRRVEGETPSPGETKALEDHLFWYSVRRATASRLPVKLHTGYYAQWAGKKDRMPLSRVSQNPAAAADLCVVSPETRFVFMHIGYPYYEDLVALAKQNPNAWVDMCWAWIVNPVASKDFLKKFLVTAPANKVLTFGGDYIPVEPVVGHARIAREGISLALAELVEEGWLSLDDALSLVEPLLNGNARALFDVDAKVRKLASAPWL